MNTKLLKAKTLNDTKIFYAMTHQHVNMTKRQSIWSGKSPPAPDSVKRTSKPLSKRSYCLSKKSILEGMSIHPRVEAIDEPCKTKRSSQETKALVPLLVESARLRHYRFQPDGIPIRRAL